MKKRGKIRHLSRARGAGINRLDLARVTCKRGESERVQGWGRQISGNGEITRGGIERGDRTARLAGL